MIEVYDIEVYPNFFLYQGIDIHTLEKTQFIFHESTHGFEMNFPYSFYEFLTEILKGGIGFNNLNYDSQILQFIIDNYSNFLSIDLNSSLSQIYNYSQKIITSQSFPDYPEWKLKIPQLDLYKVWHFDNKNKATSLKWIQFMLDFENIQELPIPHYENIKKEQIPLITEYCWNDVNATFKLYQITKGETDIPIYKGIDKIKLREETEERYKIKCDNFSDVKIGDEIFKRKYCNIKGITKKDIPSPSKKKNKVYFKDCIPDYVQFKTNKLINFYNSIKNLEVKI